MPSDSASQRPTCVDFSASDWREPRQSARRSRSSATLSATAGAVRLSLEPASPHRRLLKVSAGLLFAAGGILMATASTGTVEQTPRRVMASAAVQAPAFFFGDRHDALADLADNRTLPGVSAPAADPLIDGAAAALQGVLPEQLLAVPSTATDHPSLRAVRDRFEAPIGTTTDEIVVAAGDTLSGILNRNGVKVDRMPRLLTDEVVKQHLASLRIGQKLAITRFPDGRFHSLSARVGKERRVTIRHSADGFATAAIDLPVEKERVVSSGTISTSLYLAAEQANLKQSTIMELAEIFQWELDFARDIRAGDRFSVVYDRLYREGRYIGDGDILAAEFVRGGKRHQAIRFTTDDGVSGYYSPDGTSKRRTFSRHPVDVVRITSHFDPNRVHPVLHRIRAHRGVDYGSPHGAPIYATADGTIAYAGTKGTFGKTVMIKHGDRVETLYAHMSKIAPISHVGKRVRQGDIIGFVGKTGRVTGTHLHYEFRKDGKHVDPLKVELPSASPLAAQYRDELRAISDQMVAQMQSVLPAASQVAAAAD